MRQAPSHSYTTVALRTLEREEQHHEARLAALRTAIDERDGGGGC
jgi:hypothetical protein